jgi:hypothetical protein
MRLDASYNLSSKMATLDIWPKIKSDRAGKNI